MADLTYQQLQTAVTDLTGNVARAAEAIRVKAARIDEEATDTGRVAEMIAGMQVDTATVGETRDLAAIMRGVSEAAIAYASAGDTTAKSAKAAHDQAARTHGRFQEAFSRAPIDASGVRREWFRQE